MIAARKGMYKCEIYEYCNWTLEGPSFVLPNGCTHKIGHYVDCQTQGIIYIVFCGCRAFYVGNTSRNFWIKIYDYIYYIGKNLLYTPIGSYMWSYNIRTIHLWFN